MRCLLKPIGWFRYRGANGPVSRAAGEANSSPIGSWPAGARLGRRLIGSFNAKGQTWVFEKARTWDGRIGDPE